MAQSHKPSVEVTRLPGGLTVASDYVAEAESVSVGLWVAVGARHEAPELNGLSHLLEHMAFKGTARRSARQIAEEIEAVGGQINAYTARETTAYYARVLSDDMGLALDMLADIIQRSTFDPDELQRERAVVLQEIGLAYDTPDDIIFDHFQEAAFPGQAMGRPILGREEIVSRLTRNDLKHYMGQHYAPDRMVLAAAGRLSHGELVARASALFSELSDETAAAPEAARYNGGEFRDSRDLEQAHLILGFPAVSLTDPEIYTQGLLSTLLGGGMSSRLFQEIREKRGLVYSVYSFASSFTDGGLFGIYAGTGEDEAAEILPLLADELGKVGQKVEADELQRAKAQARASLLMGRESTSGRAESLAGQILTYGRPLSTQEMLAEIEAVDEARIARLARRLFAGRPTLAALGPVKRVEDFERLSQRFA